MPTIQRRTFEARQQPEGSAERARLNLNALTSEYMISYRYIVTPSAGEQPLTECNNGFIWAWPINQTYPTKHEAEEAIREAAKKRGAGE